MALQFRLADLAVPDAGSARLPAPTGLWTMPHGLDSGRAGLSLARPDGRSKPGARLAERHGGRELSRYSQGKNAERQLVVWHMAVARRAFLGGPSGWRSLLLDFRT